MTVGVSLQEERDMQRNMALGYHPLLQSVAGYEGLGWADPVPSTDGWNVWCSIWRKVCMATASHGRPRLAFLSPVVSPLSQRCSLEKREYVTLRRLNFKRSTSGWLRCWQVACGGQDNVPPRMSTPCLLETVHRLGCMTEVVDGVRSVISRLWDTKTILGDSGGPGVARGPLEMEDRGRKRESERAQRCNSADSVDGGRKGPQTRRWGWSLATFLKADFQF